MHNSKTHSASEICGTCNATWCHIPEDPNMNILLDHKLNLSLFGHCFYNECDLFEQYYTNCQHISTVSVSYLLKYTQ